MDDLVRAINDLVVQLRTPGLGRNTTTTFTNPATSESGLEPGTVWDNGGFAALAGRDPINPTIQALQFDTTETIDPAPGQLTWSDSNGTLSLGLKGGDVDLHLGEKTLMRVQNNTGSAITSGAAVGFAGVNGNNRIEVAPYLADGSANSLFFVGVAAEDIANAGTGFVCVYGRVGSIDTTGAPFSETWAVGDLLWADPVNAGGLTNSKPTAPNNVVSVAAVLAVDDTNGEIFVRPTIELDKLYGVFSDTTAAQSIAATYTPQAVTFNTTDIANGISRGSPTSRIVVDESGLYKFAFSMQVESNSSSAKKLWIWPRINGTDVPNSNSEITFSGSGTVLVPAWSWTLSLTANQYFELIVAGDSTDIDIISKAAETGAAGGVTFARPASPSVILEVTEVQQ
jgi:hypothetical protein